LSLIKIYVGPTLLFITLGMSSRKHNVTVWCLSVRLFRQYTHRDSPGCSMWRGRHTFWPEISWSSSKEY